MAPAASSSSSSSISESCGTGDMVMRVSCSVGVWRLGGGEEGVCGLEATESRLDAILVRVPPWPPLLRLRTDSRRELREYLLDRLERLDTEERSKSCSCSEILDGPGTGGRGAEGGPVGGGLGVVGVGGMCVGGAGNDSIRIGTGGRFLPTEAAIVGSEHERMKKKRVYGPPVIPIQPIPFSAMSHFWLTKQISIDQLFTPPSNPSV